LIRLHHAEEEAEVPFAKEAECPPELVAVVIIRSITTQSTKRHHSNILSAEMDCQGVYKSVPWRTHTGEEVEAHVQAEPASSSSHGP
jgi:hypothetical protein